MTDKILQREQALREAYVDGAKNMKAKITKAIEQSAFIEHLTEEQTKELEEILK